MTALENLARVIDPNALELDVYSQPLAAARRVVAFLTSDEAVDRAARSAHENPHPWQVASGDWGAAGHEIREAFIAQQRAAILAALGVESLPLDPEPWHAPDPVTTRNRVMRCDTCGKFRTAADMERRPVTQEDYLFGDPGPYFDCATCVNGRKSNG